MKLSELNLLTEDEVNERLEQLRGPRVSQESLDDLIVDVTFFEYENAIACAIKLRNGFKVLGEFSAGAANHDPDIGRYFAFKSAKAKIWPFEGYLLRNNEYVKETSIGQP